MYIQIVTFNLNGMTDAEYRQLCEEAASVVAAQPGLISKVFLANRETNTYGGVYTWRDREAMVAYTESEFFKAFAATPTLANAGMQAFGVLDGPTRVTHGLLEAVV